MSQYQIKPIPTFYQFHKFRSRLEARWYIFFKELAKSIEYEDEAYNLPSGNYLPDFHLPNHNIIVEIKPELPPRRNIDLAVELSDAKNMPVLIVAGMVWPQRYKVIICDNYRSNHERIENCELEFAKCRRCDGLCLCGYDRNPIDYMDIGKHTCRCHDKSPVTPRPDSYGDYTWDEDVGLAYTKARSEQFYTPNK